MRDRGMMYKEVEHTVLLHGSESWVVTGVLLKILEGFFHRAAIQITGIMGKRVADRK